MRSSVTPPDAAPRSRAPAEPRARGFRADIEGLRAVAVMLVVLYHAGVAGLPGGYVGVDVFYVISGFLITGLLVSEARTTGSISLRRFWARRVRRLLPASAIVLVTTAIATASIYAGVDRPGVGGDIRAAALYVSNWRFAANAVDYLGADAALSPVVHYWSLSVEEQFYLLWPVLLVVLIRLGGRRWLSVVRAAIVVIGAGSLAASIVLTRTEATTAYFALHTRAWELAVGAGLALAGDRLRRLNGLGAQVAGAVGILLIAVAAARYSTATPFPGSAALLPVVGAAAVIAAGARGATSGASRLLALRPMTHVGRISYGLYLWHWPVLVLLKARFGTSWRIDVTAVLASLVLAALSSRLVEQPVRQARWLRRRTIVTLASGAVLTALPVLVAGRMLVAPATSMRPSAPIALLDVAVHPATKGTPLAMTPTSAIADVGWAAHGCYGLFDTPSAPDVCTFGDVTATRTVVLLGDSHAAALIPAFSALGRKRHFRLMAWAKPGCPFIDLPMWFVEQKRALVECDTWRENVLTRIRAHGKVDSIFLARSWFERGRVRDPTGGALSDPVFDRTWSAATAAMLARLRPLAESLDLIADVPTAPSSVPRCVSANPSDVSACNFPRSVGAHPDRELLHDEAGPARASGASFVDLTPLLCTAEACPGVTSDGLIVYIDESHITATFSATLALLLERAIAQATSAPPRS